MLGYVLYVFHIRHVHVVIPMLAMLASHLRDVSKITLLLFPMRPIIVIDLSFWNLVLIRIDITLYVHRSE